MRRRGKGRSKCWRGIKYQRREEICQAHCNGENAPLRMRVKDGWKAEIRMQACELQLVNNWRFWRAGNRGQGSDPDKSSSCGAPQHGRATNCPSAAPDRRPSLDVRTIESFFSLRWATLRRQTESRHCVVSKISQSPASSHFFFFSDIFTSCWHPPPTSSSLSYDVLSIHCNKND